MKLFFTFSFALDTWLFLSFFLSFFFFKANELLKNLFGRSRSSL